LSPTIEIKSDNERFWHGHKFNLIGSPYQAKILRELVCSVRQSKIFYLICGSGKTPTELAKILKISRTAVTFTLNKWLILGVIKKQRKGRNVVYSVEKEKFYDMIFDIIHHGVDQRHENSFCKDYNDKEKITRLFKNKKFREFLNFCLFRLAKQQNRPLIKLVDDLLNVLQLIYISSLLKKPIELSGILALESRELLKNVDPEIRDGIKALMKYFLANPPHYYTHHLSFLTKWAERKNRN